MLSLNPDTLIHGRYRITRRVGGGGMGEVYQAHDEQLLRTVALKRLALTGLRAAKAFEREACTLAGLEHPALPAILDHFIAPEGRFLVMQFIEGADLGAELAARGAPFPPATALAWGDEILEALEYLHGREPPVIHRDIKPQNIKRTPAGKLVLLDFGLARGTLDASGAPAPSLFGYTAEYAPIEQIEGSGTDARSDIYSLSATLYHLITGHPPTPAGVRAATLREGQPDPLLPAAALRPGLPAAFEALLARGLALRAAERFPSAAAMRAAIHAALAAQPALAGSDLGPRTELPDPPAPKPIRVAEPTGSAIPRPAIPEPRPAEAAPRPAPERPGFANVLLLVLAAALAVAAIALVFNDNILPSGSSQPPATSPAPGETAAIVAPAAAGAPENLSANPGRSDVPLVAVDGRGNIHVIWKDNSPSGQTLIQLLARTRSPDGRWSEPALIGATPALPPGRSHALLRRPDGAVCALWHPAPAEPGGEAGLYQSCHNGQGWAEPTLRPDPSDADLDLEGELAFDAASELHRLFEGEGGRIFFDGAVKLPGEPGTDAALTIGADGVLHAIWSSTSQPGALLHSSSRDGGANWSAPVYATESAQASAEFRLAAGSDDAIHLAWASDGDIIYRGWTAGTWGEATVVGAGPFAGPGGFGLATGPDGLAWIAWHDSGGVWLARQTGGGWSSPTRVAPGPISGAGPHIAVDAAGAAHIVWAQSDGAEDVYYARVE